VATVALIVVLLAAVVVAAHAAQKLVAGQLCGGGGGGAGGGMKLVGSIPASAAGSSSGGGLKLTGGFNAAAQTWAESSAATDAIATAGSGMVSALAAVPTAGGAQITFTLSAPATVEVRVLNIAGRPIKTIAPGRECEAGLNTVTWTGMSDAGLRVPAGRYLVEVRARSAEGSESRAIAAVGLGR
jgi:hypothetical protein